MEQSGIKNTHREGEREALSQTTMIYSHIHKVKMGNGEYGGDRGARTQAEFEVKIVDTGIF